MPKQYETVIFDFDGVLCHDRFYTNLQAEYPEVHQFIETKVFGGGSDLPDRWMRNEVTAHDVNRLISQSTGMNFDVLSAMLVQSVREMRIDSRLTALALRLIDQGVLVALVTSNMDVFNEVTIEHRDLRRFFPVIVNSCDYGCLKHEANGRLFDIAMEQLGKPGAYGRALLIDDSSKARGVFEGKGGNTFAYTDYDTFARWFRL